MDAYDVLNDAGIDVDDVEELTNLLRYTFSLAVVDRAQRSGLKFNTANALAFARSAFDELAAATADRTVDYTMINTVVEKMCKAIANGALPEAGRSSGRVELDDEEDDVTALELSTYRRITVVDSLSVGERYQSAGLLPQQWLPRRGDYVGYYLNQHHEDLVFIARRRKRDAILLHSDLGWEPAYVVDGRVPNVVLDPDEQMFVELCWRTAASPLFGILDQRGSRAK